jgi:uncharacterized protein (TIGR03083 family)
MTGQTMKDRGRRENLIAASEMCFDRIRALGRDLSDDEWEVRSLCPDWSIREVLAHTAGVEDALLGWAPSVEDMPPFGKASALVSASTSMSAGAFLDRVDQILDGRLAELRRLTDADVDAESLTPVGPQTYGRFLAIRVFDLWVHERDASIPLGRATEDDGLAAEIAVDEVQRSMGYIVGKKIGLPDGMSIRFDLHGPVERQIAVVVDGRATPVDSLAEADVVISVDSTAFMMLACGRIDPQETIDGGRISWSGDAEWGETAARNLGFTM